MAHGMNANRHNNHPSSERRYDRFITRIDGKPVGCRKLVCATEGCGQEGEILDRTGDGLPPKVIERRFTQKGWEVGRNPKHDFCPNCVAERASERRSRRNGNKIKSFAAIDNVFRLTPPVTPPQAEGEIDVQTAAESPNVMSRADRRIIHNQLEEVYADETTGYKPGWSDAQVQRHLGMHIPLSWIAEVREQSFGPVKDNEEVRDMLKRVTEQAGVANVLREEIALFRKDYTALTARANDLIKRCGDVGKSLDGLVAIATRIEKAVL